MPARDNAVNNNPEQPQSLTPEQRATAEQNNRLLQEAWARGGREEFDRVYHQLIGSKAAAASKP